MNRAKLLLSLAINEKLIQTKDAARILIDFSNARKTNHDLTFEKHTLETNIFSQDQIEDINQKFSTMLIKCKNCEAKIKISDLSTNGNWVCPTCNTKEFNLVKSKPSERNAIPFESDIPPTLADKPISKLYKTASTDSPFMGQTSVQTPEELNHEEMVEPTQIHKIDDGFEFEELPDDKIDSEFRNAEVDMEPMSFEDDLLVAPADEDAIEMTVADGHMIHADSFDVKSTKDSGREEVLIAKDDMLIDSNDRVMFEEDEESQLIVEKDVFTPADNLHTILEARKTTEKLPDGSTGISNRTAIEMNGQEVIHKGITPESLEKGLPEGAILDGFEILGILGRGGMGIVYNGHDLALNRRVAIKVLSPNILQNETQIKRFEIEAQACASLEHQNVVNIYRFGTIYNHPYIVMQFVDGKSLNDIIKEDGALPVEQVIDYLVQAARGLTEAHHRNIIHRDIKPDNLLVDNRGVVKILDFGLAKQTTSDAQLSQTGYFLGTPAYISPEQASGDPADLRADVYSLGISAFQMLTGKLPFSGTAAQVVTAHLIQELPSITEINPECPLSLEAVISKMSAKSPDERYQSMDEVIEALEYVQKEVYGEIIVDYPKKGRPILVTLLFILVVLLIGAGVGLYFMGVLDPVIAEFTGKPIKSTNGDVNNPTNNGSNGETNTPIDNTDLAEQEKQKAYKTSALKIITTLSEEYWVDDLGEKREIDKGKLDEFEQKFMECLDKITDETESLSLKDKFLEKKDTYIQKWKEAEQQSAKERLAEFIKSLQKLRTDTTSTVLDIEDNLKKIDKFTEELPESASELDKFILDLQKIKKNLEKLDNLNTKSKEEKDPKTLLNYLDVLGEIVKVDGKDYKFEDRDDVKAYKYELISKFEAELVKLYNSIKTMTETTELDGVQGLVDIYDDLKILSPKEKQKYDYVNERVEERRNELKHIEDAKILKEGLIQEIEENIIDQNLEKLQSLKRKINRQETDYPEIFKDSEFMGWIEKLDKLINRLVIEEEELSQIQERTEKLASRCDSVDINDKTKIGEIRILKRDIEDFIDENAEILAKERLKKESDKLNELHEKCINYLRKHTVEIYTENKDKNLPWQLEKAGSFKGELFNMRLDKIYSKFAWRQPAKITSMQYVKNGNSEYVVTGSIDKTIRLWDMKTMTEVRILKNEASVTSLAYKISKNKDIILFAGLSDGTIAVWNPIYSKVKNYTTIHSDAVTSIVVINNMAISSSEDETVVGWDYKEETLNLQGEVVEEAELTRSNLVIKHPDVVFDVAVSADKTLFATACGDQKVRIYNMNGALVNTIKGFFGAVYSVAFEPTESKLIAASGEENNVKIFRIQTGDLFAELKGHKHYVTNVKYNEVGKLVSTSLDRTSIQWNIGSKEPEVTYTGKLPYSDFVFTNDNHIIFSQWDGGFCKFRFTDGQRINLGNHSHQNQITGISKISEKEILTTSIDGKIYIWNKAESNEPVELDFVGVDDSVDISVLEKNVPVTSFKADNSVKYGLFGRLDGSAFLLDLETRKIHKVWKLEQSITVVSLAIVANEESETVYSIIGTKGGYVYVKALDDSVDEKLKVKGNTVSSIAISNDSKVAISGFSSEVVIFNLLKGEIDQKLDNSLKNSIVTAISFSDSATIAIGYKEHDGGVVRVYNLADSSVVTTYSELEESVVSLDFVLDDKTVLVIDGTAMIKCFKINDDGSNLENFSANIGACGDKITSTYLDSDFGILILGTSRGAVLVYKVERN